MGMGMPDGQGLPDTFGLPEYFVTEVVQEIAGSNVRMICGVKRGNQIHWLYSVVVPADRLILHSQNCQSAAMEAFNLHELVGGKAAH